MSFVWICSRVIVQCNSGFGNVLKLETNTVLWKRPVHWILYTGALSHLSLPCSLEVKTFYGREAVELKTCIWKIKSQCHFTWLNKVTRVTVIWFHGQQLNSRRNRTFSVQTGSETHYVSFSWGKIFIFSRQLTFNIHMVPRSSMHGIRPPFPHTSAWSGAQQSTVTYLKFWYCNTALPGTPFSSNNVQFIQIHKLFI
jgi:hypothetical protein